MDTVATALEEAASRFKDINEVTSQGGSDIQKFYQGSVVFVTGANGFMGKLLVEKLLRACSVKKIYILLRGKKGKTIPERLNDMKKDPVFDYVRETQPNFGDKIVPVDGDVAGIHLGICDQDWRILREEINIIFHLAATTRFDERLQLSTLINTRGTREILHLAKQCVQLRLIDGWPNTYAFTKAVAEELVRNMADELPICIVRAPIVINTYYEPASGWLDKSCVYGPTGVVLAVVLGFHHLACADESKLLCLMPGDYVNNTILATAWDCMQRRAVGDNDIKIYTVSSTRSDVRFSTISISMNKQDLKNYVTPKAIWYCFTFSVKSKLLYRILSWFLHYIPAFIADFCIYVFKVSKPKGIRSFVDLYKKMDKIEATYDYFRRHGWSFDDQNVVELHQKMSPVDQKIFNVDTTTINWEHLIFTWAVGIRKYILKESKLVDNDAIKKQKLFKAANYVILFVYLYVFYYILCLMYSFFK